jgi:hypothetical protein
MAGEQPGVGTTMAFTHLELVNPPIEHRASTFEIRVYRVTETGEHHRFVAKDGFRVRQPVATAGEGRDPRCEDHAGPDISQALIDAVIDDIDRNEFGDH